MFCENCGIRTIEGSKFCQSCGHKVADQSSESIQNPVVIGSKNYRPIFLNYFAAAILLGLLGKGSEDDTVFIIWAILFCVFVYSFCRTIHKAMTSIGKKNYWPLGLLAIIPFGFLIAFFVVRGKLKPHGMWFRKNKHK